MLLYGTYTSPYVRRVRIVAEKVGASLILEDVSSEAGQQKLRAITPIWKIPVLQDDKQIVFDSRVIIDYLKWKYGTGSLRTSSEPSFEQDNIVTVIDGALDAAINVFYLQKSELAVEQIAYVVKQQQRINSAMGWLEQRCAEHALQISENCGLAEIALVTTLDWLSFRNVYSLKEHPKLEEFQHYYQDQHHFSETRPQ